MFAPAYLVDAFFRKLYSNFSTVISHPLGNICVKKKRKQNQNSVTVVEFFI